MVLTGKRTVLFILVLLCITSEIVLASGASKSEPKTAILIASFGTTVPSAIKGITNIVDKVRLAYPETEVRTTFTSNIVRAIWKKRRSEPQTWLDQGIPEEILNVKNIIQVMGDLQEDGYRNIIVQPTHMFFMEQSHDLNAYVRGFSSIRTLKDKWKPFDTVVVGRPALGKPGDEYNYHDDLEAAVKTLKSDIEEARKEDALLIYMGHGNSRWSTGIYSEAQKRLRETYPDVMTFVGVVEGSPTLEDLLGQLQHMKTNKLILRPFMIVAGNHAVKDMAGPDVDSWKSVLNDKGYEVLPIFEGLGENDAFAGLFVDHIADAAKKRGVILK